MCIGNKRRLCLSIKCKVCFARSFAISGYAKFWSTRNKLKPWQVFKNSPIKFHFNCEICYHEFDVSPNHITHGRWCPYCAYPPQKLCDDNDCQMCFNKSFASSPMAVFWSDYNVKNPREVFKNCNTKFWFKCQYCQHVFDASPSHIITGRWCPYCANKKLCNEEKCKICFKKSFASSPMAIFWSDYNVKNPREVFKNCNTKFWFKCENDHDFDASPSHIITGRWCPKCKNKTETKLLALLELKFAVIHQFKANWTKMHSKTKNHYLPYDFCIEELNIVIELDGPQHFQQIANWEDPKETAKTDIIKNRIAVYNGFSVIRLLQTDVLDDKNEWEYNLDTAINYLHEQSEPKIIEIYDGIQTVEYINNFIYM